MSAAGLRPTLENFLWRGDDPIREGGIEPAADPSLALEGVSGHYAIHHRDARGVHWLARDRLGVNKLFFAIGPGGEVVSSNYLIDLLREGRAWDSVASVPSSHWTSIDPGARTLRLEKYAPLRFAEARSEVAPETAGYVRALRARLERVFRRIRAHLAGRPFYVTLSGGLDSSTIAVLARQHLGEFTAITFAIESGDGGPPRSDDLRAAERLASELGVPFEPVVVAEDAVLEQLDDVLLYGQDWRDFNVHCGLVNACIGRAIASRAGSAAGPRPLLLTGDTMNELMADYRTEVYEGHEFYRLPRVPPSRLRRTLVGGLDSGDREVGIFGHHGVSTLQPFALCADELACLPPELVDDERAKQAIMRRVMGAEIPDYIYDRPKTRAQSGSADLEGGTLALLTSRGIDSEWLARRFATLFSLERKALGRIIRGGFYRSISAYPSPEGSE